jgi:hypothetical protein
VAGGVIGHEIGEDRDQRRPVSGPGHGPAIEAHFTTAGSEPPLVPVCHQLQGDSTKAKLMAVAVAAALGYSSAGLAALSKEELKAEESRISAAKSAKNDATAEGQRQGYASPRPTARIRSQRATSMCATRYAQGPGKCGPARADTSAVAKGGDDSAGNVRTCA